MSDRKRFHRDGSYGDLPEDLNELERTHTVEAQKSDEAEDPRAHIYRFWLSARQDFIDAFGDIETALVLMVTEWADLANSKADVSMIANITGISRPTVRRKLEKLEARNLVRVNRSANRTTIEPTPHLVDYSEEAVIRVYNQLRQTARVMEERSCRPVRRE